MRPVIEVVFNEGANYPVWDGKVNCKFLLTIAVCVWKYSVKPTFEAAID